MGEIIGVLTNPAETVRSLTDSKRLLDEARREISENRERSQLRTKHTFSRLPGYLPRRAEMRAIERILEGEPSFTILFGASSVGKTALLREVLCRDGYHVLHFDLRIAGFADLASLYMSLSQQMEQYFEEIAEKMHGYGEFQKEAWSFKHDRLNVERRLGMTDGPPSAGTPRVMTSDVARLMELFQSSLLKYREFQPEEEVDADAGKGHRRQETDALSDRTRVETKPKSRSRWFFRGRGKRKAEQERERLEAEKERAREKGKGKEVPAKKMPVFFFDEAHKLPALIKSTETMKCILDSMLVLTKQDRLCHVIHATSDPFYQTWLRQLNVMQHCKIITVGDCSKAETRVFFIERVLPRVPEGMRARLDFENLYEAFGGKLAHWHDFITDFVKQSSHFLQAHALLNLHIIHSSQSMPPDNPAQPRDVNSSTDAIHTGIHPNLGAAGFKIYSPITHPHGPQGDGPDEDFHVPEFSAMQLLKVMSRLAQPDVKQLPYFLLCREMGVRAMDGMVKGRVLDLRWTDAVTKEDSDPPTRLRTHHPDHGSSGTAVDGAGSDDEEIVPISDREAYGHDDEDDVDDILGPKLVPISPIMRYAMREVVQEYEDVQSLSEYASLSDVDEY
ncbi:hypothetical protein PLICRDRAFT_104574 [Plicaturopsis crispa FD-325 SS-3]|nr:hypothetical protein PLICRDRAFT_104574 [Plicaturopsis crispa FD-325 SS-3]